MTLQMIFIPQWNFALYSMANDMVNLDIAKKLREEALEFERVATINPEDKKWGIAKRYFFYNQLFYDAQELAYWIKSMRVQRDPSLTKSCICTAQNWPSPIVLRSQIKDFSLGKFEVQRDFIIDIEDSKLRGSRGDPIFTKLREKVLNPYLNCDQLVRLTSGFLNRDVMQRLEYRNKGIRKFITKSGVFFHIDSVIDWFEKNVRIIAFKRRGR